MEQITTLQDPRLSIVLIDPHDAVRRTLARRLRSDERVASLVDAASVAEASNSIESSCPDVVVIDPGARRGDELHALKRLRKQAGWFLIAVHTTSSELLPSCGPTSDLSLLKGLRTAKLVSLLRRGLASAQAARGG
jgi:DNA-binding NarL/FixJ family response regulator